CLLVHFVEFSFILQCATSSFCMFIVLIGSTLWATLAIVIISGKHMLSDQQVA
ncbi:hypothetical protein ACJX0J_031272, partial [Zea mays]